MTNGTTRGTVRVEQHVEGIVSSIGPKLKKLRQGVKRFTWIGDT